jgi:hypothetical protein
LNFIKLLELLERSSLQIYGHYNDAVRLVTCPELSRQNLLKEKAEYYNSDGLTLAGEMFALAGVTLTFHLWSELRQRDAMSIFRKSERFNKTIMLADGELRPSQDIFFERAFEQYLRALPSYSDYNKHGNSRSSIELQQEAMKPHIKHMRSVFRDRSSHYEISSKAWIWVYISLHGIFNKGEAHGYSRRYTGHGFTLSDQTKSAFTLIAECLRHPLCVEAYGWPILWALCSAISHFEAIKPGIQNIMMNDWIYYLKDAGASLADFHISTLMYGIVSDLSRISPLIFWIRLLTDELKGGTQQTRSFHERPFLRNH